MTNTPTPGVSVMVERVARAMCGFDEGSGCQPWDEAPESSRNAYRALATEAIKAMREPTEEMIAAEVALHGYSGDRTLNGYRAMIDAALVSEAYGEGV